MPAEWASYRLGDLLLFSERVYRRLFEAHNDAWWPLPLLLALAGLAGLAVLLHDKRGEDDRRGDERARRRAVWLGLGGAWGFVALAFLHARYAPISPVAAAAVWAFAGQGLALGALALAPPRPAAAWRQALGAALALWGIVLYPARGVWRDGTLAAAEWFAMAPDPTAVATIGLVLAGVRSRGATALLLVVPIAWCLLSGLTLRAMDERSLEQGALDREAARPAATLLPAQPRGRASSPAPPAASATRAAAPPGAMIARLTMARPSATLAKATQASARPNGSSRAGETSMASGTR